MGGFRRLEERESGTFLLRRRSAIDGKETQAYAILARTSVSRQPRRPRLVVRRRSATGGGRRGLRFLLDVDLDERPPGWRSPARPSALLLAALPLLGSATGPTLGLLWMRLVDLPAASSRAYGEGLAWCSCATRSAVERRTLEARARRLRAHRGGPVALDVARRLHPPRAVLVLASPQAARAGVRDGACLRADCRCFAWRPPSWCSRSAMSDPLVPQNSLNCNLRSSIHR